MSSQNTAPHDRPRARGLGIPLDGTPGEWNAITDVPGVEVGHVTLIEGDDVRTGVTALLPRGRDGVGSACAAGWYSLNGNGEMTGTTWIEESGALSLPVALTNTHAVGTVHRGVIDWVAERHPGVAAQWLLPVVAETWDGYLNDINGPHVRTEHGVAALDAAATGPLAEGCVGGGTGMNCYGFKGGSGTASRIVTHGPDRYTVGALVQANFGQRRELTVAGVPMGRELLDDDPMGTGSRVPSGAGSVIVVVATDAPLLPGQCKALARRVPIGLGRTGTSGGHFSGDIFLAFSTANEGALNSTFPKGEATADTYDRMRFVPWGRMDPFYEAVVQAVEEAVLNALCAADAMTGRNGHRMPALPHARVRQLLRQ
ncbi:P1 family peptidase [Streptomyces sp. VRA16 Mangrove soil]|uniref:DmpA family aminopeptidase n=1 Tax=Streptomyces sp. VRA16 Mangrove soil TaxID=2817434 RepID=UPI001A9F401C|nr:P1 family peptidase [Streptomyces sp. VRA16 Mangrove soil]MBO1334494.1 P1 family peptidase [Streptomyces sp. VRA16 Mangrove soil]